MIIKEHVTLQDLLDFGFEDRSEDDWNDDSNFEGHWSYAFAHSRRGQSYNLLINKDSGRLSLYATEPDGSGAPVYLDGLLMVLLELKNLGYIELQF